MISVIKFLRYSRTPGPHRLLVLYLRQYQQLTICSRQFYYILIKPQKGYRNQYTPTRINLQFKQNLLEKPTLYRSYVNSHCSAYL